MSFASAWKEGEGDFLLVVAGSVRYAPYLKGWQEFKDHLRRVVKEQPGWADVYSSQSQRRGEMQGWCRIKDREDADSAYRCYSRGKHMLVHIWQTCRSSDGYRLLRCNCSVHFPEVLDGSHSPNRCGIDLGRVSQLSGSRTYTTPASFMAAVPPAYPYSAAYPPAPQTYYTTYAAHAPIVHPMSSDQSPVYSASSSGMPVNVRDGAILTEARGIFIKNLSYKVGTEDLRALLATVGGGRTAVVDCKVHRNHQGMSRGIATAQFASTQDAKLAVSHLNRKTHNGTVLKVRLDQETTVVGQVGPLVVNGSGASYW